jgi:hypothetical protein
LDRERCEGWRYYLRSKPSGAIFLLAMASDATGPIAEPFPPGAGRGGFLGNARTFGSKDKAKKDDRKRIMKAGEFL